MRPTSCQDKSWALAAAVEGWIGGVAVALHGASKVRWDDVAQTGDAACGGPGKAHVNSGSFAGPQITLFGLAMTGA